MRRAGGVALTVCVLMGGRGAAQEAGARPGEAPIPPATSGPAEPGLASPPQPKQLVPAEVPPGTRFPAPEVAVVLAIDVSALGQVEDVRLERGAGEPFDSAAVAAARKLEFTPGRLGTGEPVPVTITFRLRIAAPAEAAAEPPPPPRPVRLSGRLLERGTRRPLADAAVAARSADGATTFARASTDAEGRFTLEVPSPTFVLVGAAAGHERLEARVDARPGEEREETIYLETAVGSNVSVVRGERVRREITKQVIPADEVAAVAGTQGDTLKAVLNLPGAARTPFGGGELILRGSSPGDSSAFIEGLEVPIAYHFGGLRSTFAPRFLDALEFVPGNFAPDYGRLTGGIVNVRARDPMTDAVHGEADFNVYDAGVAVEGPLSASWSGGAAFRRSWIDAILPLVIPSDSNLSFSTAPRFYDYQFLATWKPEERDRVRFLFFGSQDKLVAILDEPQGDPSLSGDLRALIAYHFLQASWTRTFSPSLRQETWAAVGLQQVDTKFGPRLFFDLTTRRVDARSTWSWQARPELEARAGLDLQSAWYDIALDVPQVPKEGEPPTPISGQSGNIAATQSGTMHRPAAFAELRVTPREGVDLLPSLRVDWSSAIRRWSADPRLMARWRVAPRTVLEAAAGVYQQPPQPDESATFSGNPELLPKRTYQYSAGVEHRPRDGVDVEVTGFYKDLSRNVVRNLAAEVDPSQPVYLNSGAGRIFGVESLVRARFGDRFFGWIAYTFQRSFRTDRPGEAERRFDFDQPHLLTVVGTYRPSVRWTFGARFRLVSGNPYTPVDPNRVVWDASGDVWVPVYGAVNSGRLAPFNALDLRVDRIWTHDRWRLSAYLDVQNVYNRANPEGWEYRFDYGERARLTGLPILPIFGLKGEW